MPPHPALIRHVREAPPGAKIGAFFDLDRTILAGFSALVFFRERLLSGRMAPRELGESLLGMLSFAVGRTGFSGMMTAAAAAYRGLSEQVLVEFGEEVFTKHLATQIVAESRALIRAHQERGHTVVIVSSAMRYQIEPAARELGIECVLCTRLEVEGGVCTGRVVHPTCWGKGKAAAARDFAARNDVDLSQSFFYTDSADDLPLLEAVGHPRPLNPDRRLQRIASKRGWPVQRFGSLRRPGVQELLRTGLVYGSVLPAAAATGLAAGLLSRSRQQGVNLLMSTFGDLGAVTAAVDLHVEGEEHLWSRRPAVFIFNHQSGIDLLVVPKLLRRDVISVAKQELRHHPVFGPLLVASGAVFIDRAHHDRAVEALAPAVAALRHGLSVAIAPEGTRSAAPQLGPFKKGAFHIAMQAGVPIVPIVIRNSLDALPAGALLVRPTTIEVVVLPPIDVSSWTVAELDARVREVRERYLTVLRG